MNSTSLQHESLGKSQKIVVGPFLNLAAGFTMGCIASCVAVTFTNPLEVIKTRLQMDLTKMKAHSGKPTFLGTGKNIVKQEGFKALQKGLVAAYAYQSVMNGTRLGIYDPIRRQVYKFAGRDENNSIVPLNAFAGFISGAMCAFSSSPFLLIKTRLQTDKGKSGSTWGYLSGIYKEAGVKGLFHGVTASMVRTGVGSMTQLASYDFSKRRLLKWGMSDDVPTHFLASVLAGVWIATFMCPFDMITTRYYNQSASGPKVYSGALDCARKTISSEGSLALWKGWLPLFLRVGPHTIITFLVLEQLKKAWGNRVEV